MSFLGKKYFHEKDENFQELIENIGCTGRGHKLTLVTTATDLSQLVTTASATWPKRKGVPEDKKQITLNYKPTILLKKEGDEYIQSISNPDGSVKELKFKNGIEFDEEVSPGFLSKTKFTIEGNVVVQNKSFPDGQSMVIKYEYSDDGFVVAITSNKWDGVARRYYKVA